jgi:hypothetical protein
MWGSTEPRIRVAIYNKNKQDLRKFTFLTLLIVVRWAFLPYI